MKFFLNFTYILNIFSLIKYLSNFNIYFYKRILKHSLPNTRKQNLRMPYIINKLRIEI